MLEVSTIEFVLYFASSCSNCAIRFELKNAAASLFTIVFSGTTGWAGITVGFIMMIGASWVGDTGASAEGVVSSEDVAPPPPPLPLAEEGSTDNADVWVESSLTLPSAATGDDGADDSPDPAVEVLAVSDEEEGEGDKEADDDPAAEGDVTPGTLLTLPSALMVGKAVATTLLPAIRWYIDMTFTSFCTFRPAGVLHSTQSKPSAR